MKKTIRTLFLNTNEEKRVRDAYLWTMLSGLLYSGSTFVMFWAVSAACSVAEGGVFTIAMSMGQQLVTIGYFNVRTFQVSDVREEFSFSEYIVFRSITCTLMCLVGACWILAKGYTGEKAAAVVVMILFKLAEAWADVLQGRYQQKERLDVAGKCVFWETAAFLLVFLVTLLLTKSLTAALLAMLAAYVLSVLLLEGNLIGAFGNVRWKLEPARQRKLFLSCFPLFLNSFLMMYINNCAKYAIEASYGDEMLGYFNILFMPAFVINLLGGFLLKPMLTSMSLRYQEGNLQAFRKLLKKQAFFILLLTILCVGGAALLGIPVLEFVYRTDLTGYRGAMCILVTGGAFTALYTMFQYAIIIMRHQYACLIACAVTACAAFFLMPVLVRSKGILGAAGGHFLLMALLSSIYLLMTIYYLKKAAKAQTGN
ncbi:MAG: lipopolysaccharide biosynthesis protein [Eubacteriales bacterium]|nr:lipopolysaccharide biosynthesis protein [Eubacteriales bacterium]